MSLKKDGNPDMRYSVHKSIQSNDGKKNPYFGGSRGEVSKKLYDDGYPTTAIPFQVQLVRTLQDIQTYQTAVRSAENIQAPNRINLLRLYQDVVIDAQVSTVMASRKNAILSRSFNLLNKNGEIDLEKTKLLNRGDWLYKFIDYSLDSIFYGYSLIQFDYKFDFMGNRIDYDFKIDIVPRTYVCSEYGLVVPAQGQFSTGIPYHDAPYKYWNIPVGEIRDLGLLQKLSPLYIWKKNSFSSWAEYTEIFGVPMRIIKTDMTDETTKKNALHMMKNMGAGGAGIFDKNDLIEVLDGKQSDGSIFNNIIERCNTEIAKLVLGQTGTIEEKAFVGAAEIHERVLQQYTGRDEKFIENLFTTHLIPFLNLHQFGFEGCSIEIAPLDELGLQEQITNIIELSKVFDIEPSFVEEKTGIKVLGIKQDIKNDIKDVTNSIQDITYKHEGCCVTNKTQYSETIPHHPNCVCQIIGNEYVFGISKSGPCAYCVSAKDAFDEKFEEFKRSLYGEPKI